MRGRSRSRWAALVVAMLAAGGCKRGKPESDRQTVEPTSNVNRQILEPTSNIVFRSANGRTLTLDQLENAKGPVNFEILGETVPAEARALHESARKAGGAGDYDKALALLTKAAKLAPRWPYPIYDRAYTYLLMRRFDAARADYLATVKMAPRGYLTAITSADLLVREKKGEWPEGTCLAYSVLEDIPDPVEKARMLRALVNRYPKLAPAWKDLAYLAKDDKERLALIEKGLAAQPDAETRGMLLINKALLLGASGESGRASAIRALGELALDPKSTYGTAELAKLSLAQLAKRKKP